MLKRAILHANLYLTAVTVDRPKATPRGKRGDKICGFAGILKLTRFHFHPGRYPPYSGQSHAKIASEPCFMIAAPKW
jgi:hypothetical protein